MINLRYTYRLVVFFSISLFLISAPAHSTTKYDRVEVWEIAPGIMPAQWFGHVLLCFQSSKDITHGDCLDFGVTTNVNPSVVSLLKRRLVYRTTTVPVLRVIARYRSQQRDIRKIVVTQDLAKVASLYDSGQHMLSIYPEYEYDPFRKNCVTLLNEIFVNSGTESPLRMTTESYASQLVALAIDSHVTIPITIAAIFLLGDIQYSNNEEQVSFLPLVYEPIGSNWALPVFVGCLAGVAYFLTRNFRVTRIAGSAALVLLFFLAVFIHFWSDWSFAKHAWVWWLMSPLDILLISKYKIKSVYFSMRLVQIVCIVIASLMFQSLEPLWAPAVILCAVLFAVRKD